MAYDWEKTTVVNRAGETVPAIAPVILSASRATDIPAFYSEWFVRRLEAGYLLTCNPFNRRPVWVSTERTRAVVFWTKNPAPMLGRLDALDRMGLNYYFLFTLNDYDAEKLETNVPPLPARIETFVRLSERLGKSRVLWRFDPLVLTDALDADTLIGKVRRVGDALRGHTERLIFSFCAISIYRKVRASLARSGVNAVEFDDSSKTYVAKKLADLCAGWGIEPRSCAESLDLSGFGIRPNKCVDDELMGRIFPHDRELMRFLRFDGEDGLFGERPPDALRDKGQRKFCRCAVSKDVGAYDTCPFLCKYCYANLSPGSALANARRHDPAGESLLQY